MLVPFKTSHKNEQGRKKHFKCISWTILNLENTNMFIYQKNLCADAKDVNPRKMGL